MPEAYIYDAVRTPRGRGKSDGALYEVPPVRLATTVLEALRARNQLDTRYVEEVILGCVEPAAEQGGDIARLAALMADYSETVPGVQINRFCSSGLDAINLAASQVIAGQAQLAIGGGIESMSRVPMMTSGGAWFADPQAAFKTYFVPQGISADLLATRYGYSREAVDTYAVESQRRATAAWDSGYFSDSIIPVRDQNGLVLLDHDEHMRPGTTPEALAQLNPSFTGYGREFGFESVAIQRYPELERLEHVHHAGNSSGIVDGAAGVLVGNAAIGEVLGLRPRARIKAFASIGSEPCLMLTGPLDVTRKLLDRNGIGLDEIDLFEVNEAFAAVVLLYMDQLGLSPEGVNPNGGAIAFGHPLGATGAMLLGTLLDELERRDLKTGLVTLCVGAGMGTATLLERV